MAGRSNLDENARVQDHPAPAPRRPTIRPCLTLVVSLAIATLLALAAAEPAPTLAQTRAPSPTRTPSVSTSPTPTATSSPSPTATPSPSPIAEPSPTPTATATRAYPVPDDQPSDYDILNGHFYSQAVPGAPRGFGFSVANAAGIPFWSEYVRLGGLAELGYPISRRFMIGADLVQAFQNGLLRWRPELGRAEIEPLSGPITLPPPAAAPEPPARLGMWASHQPWSGWWWPATSKVRGPHLFDLAGPLAKYDQFVTRRGREDPRTLQWERDEIWLDSETWAGHCNGWAAAALLEPEPTAPITAEGISFGVADQKGLLVAYHFADSALWLHGTPEQPLSPVDFHYRLVEWLGNGKKGFILTFRPNGDDEVWSYPASGFQLAMGPDPADPNVTHVQATVWLADNDVPADFVGLRPWRGGGQTYEYALVGPRDAPTGGEWTGRTALGGFARPAIIWYPDPDHRNVERQLVSPNLDYRMIRRILGRR